LRKVFRRLYERQDIKKVTTGDSGFDKHIEVVPTQRVPLSLSSIEKHVAPTVLLLDF